MAAVEKQQPDNIFKIVIIFLKMRSNNFSFQYQNGFCFLTGAIRLHTKLCEIWVKHIFV